MLANDLATYLKTAMGASLPANCAIVIGFAPAEMQNVVMLLNPLNGFKGNRDIPGYFRGPFQVVVRHTDPLTGWDIANSVNQALTLKDVTVGGYFIQLFNPTTEPCLYPRNPAELYELSTNFDVAFSVG